ncbi:hypothetical protein IW18_20270 [Flavobacterium hibernum]|uniref:Uncharacterized protein n=1 Tax=Flavobacterium hibernum TaxID=37752 RepID=A0A0D0EJG4_9FLAO|nr:hypothetical protein IW18_20270 [Flavobacterium hibernum]OXA86122.1 hypothetical protein B0A73_14790 [Flavobacterium hibernum]
MIDNIILKKINPNPSNKQILLNIGPTFTVQAIPFNTKPTINKIAGCKTFFIKLFFYTFNYSL